MATFAARRNLEFLPNSCAEYLRKMAGVGSGQSGVVSGDFIGNPAAAGHEDMLSAEGAGKRSQLVKHVFDFAQNRATLRFVFDGRSALELLQKFALALVQLGGRLHPDVNQ